MSFYRESHAVRFGPKKQGCSEARRAEERWNLGPGVWIIHGQDAGKAAQRVAWANGGMPFSRLTQRSAGNCSQQIRKSSKPLILLVINEMVPLFNAARTFFQGQ
jgi:hypothetical protein